MNSQTERLLLQGAAGAIEVARDAASLPDGAAPRGVAVSLQGPAVLEEAFFTGRIDAGWTLNINAAGDILLARGTEA